MTTTMTTTKRIRTALLSSALLFALAVAQPLRARAFAPVPAPAADDTSAYATGTRAMNEHRWRDAIAAFDKVIEARDKKDKRADAALYWKAYSLSKIHNPGLALATCSQLRTQYASSSWNKDCAALNINTQTESGSFVMPPMPPIPPMPPFGPIGLSTGDPNTDIKILALNSLLHQDPAKAIPMLRGILAGNQSDSMKKHAIFILAQSKSPEAQSILHDAVTGKMDPELQRQAIMMMAIFQGKRDNDTLAEVYRTTNDPKTKKSIISAFFITQDAPRMVELARNEKDLDLKRSIVSQLAIMHDKAATDYMMELIK